MRNTHSTGPCRALTAAIVGAVLVLVSTGADAQRRPPNYSVSSMPETDFDCRDRTIGGYYADPETECQMFHVCVKVPGIGVQDFRFLCPNDTAFDQEHQICDDWYNIDCESETLYLSSKFDLYRLGSGAAQTSSPPRPQAAKKGAPIPLGPSTPRALPDIPRPNPRPVNSNAVGRHDDEDVLQRADTGDRRLQSQRDIFREASSGNFFHSKSGGRDDDDDYEQGSRFNSFPRQQKPSKTTTTTTTTASPYYQQQRKKKVVVHRKPVGSSSAEVNQPAAQRQPQSGEEDVDDAYYNTYQDDLRSNVDSANQAFGQRGNFPATRTTAEPYYQPSSSTQAPTQAPTQGPSAVQQTRARYNTIQRAQPQPTTEQPQNPSTHKAYSLFYQQKNSNYQSTQAPVSPQYNNYRQPVTPSTQAPTSQQYNNYRQPVNPSTQAPTSQQYNNYRQPVSPSTTATPSSQQYNNYKQPVNPASTQSSNYYNKQSSTSSSTENYYNKNNNNYYKQPVSTSSTTQAPFKYNANNYYKQPVTTTTTQAPNYYNNNNNNFNNYRQPAATSSTQTPNNYYYTTTQAPNYNYYTTTTTQAPYNNYNQYKQPVTTTTNYYQTSSSTQAPAFNNNGNYNNANNYYNQNRFNNNSGESSSSSEEYEKVEEQEFLKTAPSSNYKPSDFNVYNRAYNKDTAVESTPKPAPFSQYSQTSTTVLPKQNYYSAAPSSAAPQPAKNNYYDQPRPFSSASASTTTTTQNYYQNYQTSPAPARKYTAKVIPSNAAPVAKTSAEAVAPTVQAEKSPKKNDYAYEYYDDDVGVYEYGEDPISDAHFSKIKTNLNKIKPTN